MWVDLAITLVKILFIIGVTVGFFAPILTWVERKQSAIMQDRIGANRADILGFTAIGLFHCLADALKMFTKEDFIPFPDTSATPNPYLPLPKSEKL